MFVWEKAVNENTASKTAEEMMYLNLFIVLSEKSILFQ